MLLLVGVVWKFNGRPNFDPPPVEPTLFGVIELKLGRINYHGGQTKRIKIPYHFGRF